MTCPHFLDTTPWVDPMISHWRKNSLGRLSSTALPARPAARDEPPAGPQGLERTIPGGRAHVLEHDIGAHREILPRVEGRLRPEGDRR